MNTRDILNAAKEELTSLDSHLIDVLDIKRPTSLAYAKQLAKVISKLSPLLGNMIEFSTVGKRVGSHVQNSHNISFIFCIKFTITNSHTCFLLLKFT